MTRVLHRSTRGAESKYQTTAFSPDGAFVLAGSMQGYVYLWRLGAPGNGPLWATQLVEEETSAVAWAGWTFD